MRRGSQKEVIRRIKKFRPIASAARQLATVLGEAMAAKLAAVVPAGESLPDLGAFSRHLGALLETALDVMEAAAAELARIRAELRQLRDERVRLSEVLRQELKKRRGFFQGALGKRPTESFLLLRGKTPRDPHEVERWASLVIDRLRDPSVEMPPLVRGIVLSRRVEAEELEGHRDRLRNVLRAIDEQASEEKHAISELDEAKKAVDKDGGKVARFLVAAHDLAGNEEVAARIRLELKPRGRPKKKSGEQEAVAAAPSEPGLVKTAGPAAESPPKRGLPKRGAARAPDVDPLPAEAAVKAGWKENRSTEENVRTPQKREIDQETVAALERKGNVGAEKNLRTPSKREINQDSSGAPG